MAFTSFNMQIHLFTFPPILMNNAYICGPLRGLFPTPTNILNYIYSVGSGTANQWRNPYNISNIKFCRLSLSGIWIDNVPKFLVGTTKSSPNETCKLDSRCRLLLQQFLEIFTWPALLMESLGETQFEACTLHKGTKDWKLSLKSSPS